MEKKYLFISLLVILSFLGFAQTKNEYLFPIIENEKFGFINSKGETVIKPIYQTVSDFSEGLAAERINGTYGYIDSTGRFIIQPQFDYATPFNCGLALVYLDGKPLFINKQGQKAFGLNFVSVTPFENGRAEVKTKTKKSGYINTQGKLLIDTVYSSIYNFYNGRAVVHDTTEQDRVGVIDTLGNFIIPIGKYKYINDLVNGYFKVDTYTEPWDTIEGYTSKNGFTDNNGDLIFLIDNNKAHSAYISDDAGFNCGFVKAMLHKDWREKDGMYSTQYSYQGFINLKGEIIINDTNYEYVKDFSNNRAFVENEHRDYFLINTKGKLVSKDTFDDIIGEGFKNGVAFVEKNNKYGLIDTNANFIIPPTFEHIDNTGMIDDYFFFYEYRKDTKDKYESDKLYGIAKKDGSITLPPTMEEIDRSGFKNGLLKCLIYKQLTYIDKGGKIVWQEAENQIKQLKNLNIDFMTRGHFYSHSKPHKGDVGGFGGSENEANKITKKQNFPKKTLSVIINHEIKDTIYGDYNAIKVFVANTTKKRVEFNAQDSRLYMTIQAKDKNSEWKDIEYLPSSWCGNSYHKLTLQRKQYWEFTTPVYEGDFKTKLRIKLEYLDSNNKPKEDKVQKEITIYSNEYDGSINPAQFWRKQEYYPKGIMDPYND